MDDLARILKFDPDRLGVICWSEGARWALPLAVRSLLPPLVPHLGEIDGGHYGYCVGHAFLLAKICLVCRGVYGDDSSWAGYLELQAGIVRDDHELRESWPP